MTMTIRRAERQMAKIKLAITGVSGSGKTFSALRLARGLVGPEGRILMGDTENRSGDLYAENFEFDKVDIEPPFTYDKFEDLVKLAHAEKYDALIIDSASHFWEGVLEYKGALDKRGGNSYTNWGEAGDKFKIGLNAILQTPLHVIVCLRSKTEYSMEKDGGKTTVRKLGLAPVFREGCDFEFSTVFDIAMDHTAATSKDRTQLFKDKIFQITEATGQEIAAWLKTATPKAEPLPPEPITDEVAHAGNASKLRKLITKEAGAGDPIKWENVFAYKASAFCDEPRERKTLDEFTLQELRDMWPKRASLLSLVASELNGVSKP